MTLPLMKAEAKKMKVNHLFGANDDLTHAAMDFQKLIAKMFTETPALDEADQEWNDHLVSASSWKPATASLKQLFHFAQLVEHKRFEKYDYGIVKNLHDYGSTKPQKIGLAGIHVPTALFVGGKDPYSTPIDVKWLGE